MRSPFDANGDQRDLLPGISVHMMVKDPPIDRMAMLVMYLSPYVDEFVIIDTGSSPETIAKMEGWNRPEFPPVLVYHEDFVDFATTRNKGLMRHKHEWTVGFDPDELPSLQMLAHIAAAASEKGKLLAPEAVGWLYWTMNYWDGVLGPAMEYHWHTRLWKTRGSFLYRPIHELVCVAGLPESNIRDSIQLPKAPVEAYLIHSKAADEIEKADNLYRQMGEVSK